MNPEWVNKAGRGARKPVAPSPLPADADQALAALPRIRLTVAASSSPAARTVGAGAVAYVVWDGNAAYYLLGGADPALRTSGASSLLLWEALRRARDVTDVFDFEGSMLAPVERFFRGFGAVQTPYLRVSRATARPSGRRPSA